MKLCCVCLERPRKGTLFCDPCGRSYDKNAYADGTLAALVAWAAKRARRYEKARRPKPPQHTWDDDLLQFSRLIDEISATQDGLDVQALCDSMDLQPGDVDELFERARKRWEEIKKSCVTTIIVRD